VDWKLKRNLELVNCDIWVVGRKGIVQRVKVETLVGRRGHGFTHADCYKDSETK
jgi:hypothetical protein